MQYSVWAVRWNIVTVGEERKETISFRPAYPTCKVGRAFLIDRSCRKVCWMILSWENSKFCGIGKLVAIFGPYFFKSFFSGRFPKKNNERQLTAVKAWSSRRLDFGGYFPPPFCCYLKRGLYRRRCPISENSYLDSPTLSAVVLVEMRGKGMLAFQGVGHHLDGSDKRASRRIGKWFALKWPMLKRKHVPPHKAECFMSISAILFEAVGKERWQQIEMVKQTKNVADHNTNVMVSALEHDASLDVSSPKRRPLSLFLAEIDILRNVCHRERVFLIDVLNLRVLWSSSSANSCPFFYCSLPSFPVVISVEKLQRSFHVFCFSFPKFISYFGTNLRGLLLRSMFPWCCLISKECYPTWMISSPLIIISSV